MHESDLHHDLDAVARHGHDTARLGPAAEIRARADRRRRRRRTAGAVLAAVAVAGTVGVTAVLARPDPEGPPATQVGTSTGTAPQSSAPAAPSSAAVTGGTGDPFSGKRQVRLLPVGSEATLGIGTGGRAGLSESFDDSTLFALIRIRDDQYHIRTAKLRVGDEPQCLEVKGQDVVAAACDASKGTQLFRFRNTGTVEGKPKYTIRTGGDIYIVQDPDGTLQPGGTGIVAAQIGEGTPDIDTPFLMPDQGAASLPTLD